MRRARSVKGAPEAAARSHTNYGPPPLLVAGRQGPAFRAAGARRHCHLRGGRTSHPFALRRVSPNGNPAGKSSQIAELNGVSDGSSVSGITRLIASSMMAAFRLASGTSRRSASGDSTGRSSVIITA